MNYRVLFFNVKFTSSNYNNIYYDGTDLIFRYFTKRDSCLKEYYINCDENKANAILKDLGLFCLKTIKPSTGETSLKLYNSKLNNCDLFGQSFLGTQEQLLQITAVSDVSVIKDPVVAYDKISNYLNNMDRTDKSLWLVSVKSTEKFFNGRNDPMFGRPGSFGICYFYNKVEDVVPHDSLLDITKMIAPIEFAKGNGNLFC